MKLQKKIYKTLPTGAYDATVESISEKSGTFGPQFEWRFALDGDTSLLGWTSAVYSEKSKLCQWARAILGAVGDDLDTDALLAKPCRLYVVEKPRDDGSMTNKIESVLPAGKPKPVAAVDEVAKVEPF